MTELRLLRLSALVEELEARRRQLLAKEVRLQEDRIARMEAEEQSAVVVARGAQPQDQHPALGTGNLHHHRSPSVGLAM